VVIFFVNHLERGKIMAIKMAVKMIGLLFLVVFVVLSVPMEAYADHDKHKQSCQNGVVTVTHSTNDLWKTITAIRIAAALAQEEKGCKRVTLFLAIEGVRNADSTLPQDLNFGRDPVTLGEALEDFIATEGTRVWACGGCLNQIGLLTERPHHLLEGVEVPTRAQLVEMYAEANVNLVF
jgi:sulfur relay (sulfurtransferase) complex TusBCD TusD component (DsrE family)